MPQGNGFPRTHSTTRPGGLHLHRQGGQYAAWRKFYNRLGQLIQSQTMGAQVWDMGSGTEVSRTLLQDAWYNAYGEVIKQSTPYSSTLTSGYITPDTTKPATLTSYDALGRPAQVLAPDGAPTNYTYLDLETRVADALGNTTRTLFDVWGRTAQVIPPVGPGVSYIYDTRDQLLSASRGGVTTLLEYDFAGRKTRMVDPDMGEWLYGYDALGNLTQQTDARLCTTTLSYDPLNRLTGKTYANCPATPQVSYGYDAGPYGKGYRTSMSDGSGGATWSYDARGRMTGEARTISGQVYTTQWGYNSADLPVSMTYPDNEIVTNTYKPQLLLNSVYGTNTYVSSTIYDSASRMTARSLGNGLNQAFNYNPWTSQGGRLQSMTVGSLQSLAYQYDLVGNITQIQDAITSETQTFGYDVLYRLTSATASNGLAPYNESYTYDPATGNLASKAGVSYTYDANHPHAIASLSNGRTYQHDANGNQLTRNIGSDTFSLLYDAENHLVEVKKNGLTIATFTYDGDGKRVKSVVGGETTLFIGRHYELVNSSATKYYFAGDQRIALRKNGTLYYLLSDHLGSTSITTDASGNKTSELKYKAWGEVRYASGAPVPDYTFTGQYSNIDDFGLLFYGARWYDPSLNRWTSPDSVIPDYYHPLDFDRYQYVRSSPLKYNDPSGHIPACDKDDWACQFHWDDPVAEDWLMDDTETWGDIVIETLMTMVVEPLDWWSMAEDCASGNCSPWMLLGLLPVVPGSIGKNVNNVTKAIPDGTVDDIAESITGGVYKLTNPEGKVVRVGRTKNLPSRMSNYKNDPNFFDLHFETEYRTNDYATQRGLEQGLYDKYKPSLNVNQPISPTNRNFVNYTIAAYNFLLNLFGLR